MADINNDFKCETIPNYFDGTTDEIMVIIYSLFDYWEKNYLSNNKYGIKNKGCFAS